MTGEEGYGEEGYTVRGQNRYTIDSWSRKHTGHVAFLLGLFVGAGAAFLATSMSDREARERIVETSKALTDRADGCYSTARDKVTGAVEKGRNFFRQIGPALTTAIQSGRETYAAEKRKVTDEIKQASR